MTILKCVIGTECVVCEVQLRFYGFQVLGIDRGDQRGFVCESVFEWMMAAGAVELRQENGPLFVCLATREGQEYNGRHLQGLHYCGPLLGPDPPIFKAN